MRYITHLFRILVGLLFIFSGFIKSNDTKGFAIKLHEYFEVFSQDVQAEQDSFTINFESVYASESYSIPLYEKEEFKTFSINTMVSDEEYVMEYEEVDSATGKTISILKSEKEMVVFCNQASNNILRDTLYAEDSAFAGNVIVTATVGGNEIYNKTISLNIEKTTFEEAIDVSKYLHKSSWLVGFYKGLSGFATAIAMFICLFEIFLGLCLLIGFKSKFTVWMLLLMTLFFTFLTFYSAYYNKVTDCGCFGDAIKLTPWDSFKKDVILTILILWLFFTAKFIKPIFSPKFAKTLLILLMGAFTLFTMYCYLYLPVFDFLKYSAGSNLRKRIAVPEGALKYDLIEKVMLYNDSNGKEVLVTYNSENNTFTPNIPEKGTFIKTISEKTIKEAYKPEIHDWMNIYNNNGVDVADSIMQAKGYTLLLVSIYLDEVHKNVQPKLNKLHMAWSKTGHGFYAMTSSGGSVIDEYRQTKDVLYPFYSADNKLLASMIRSNPGLILIKDAVVIKRWPFRNLPTIEELNNLTLK